MNWSPDDTGKALEHVGKVWDWLKKRWPSKPTPIQPVLTDEIPERGILVIGPGGTGKSTFALLLSGRLQPWVFGDIWKYQESIGEEVFSVLGEPSVEIVIPAGQQHRREVSWADVRADIGSGRYSGVVLTTAFGHHSFTGLGYKSHPFYRKDKRQFLADFAEAKRLDEDRTLEFLLPALESAPGKMWLITLVTKQDLWWSNREAVLSRYSTNIWKESLDRLANMRGARSFRHELCPVSHTLSNLKDPEGTVLFPTTAGYDTSNQAESVERLFRTFDSLRQWEEE